MAQIQFFGTVLKHEPACTQVLRRQLGRPIFPVHRLDRRTTGCLLIGLTPGAAGCLQTASSTLTISQAIS
eukprot:gene8911-biopygen5449